MIPLTLEPAPPPATLRGASEGPTDGPERPAVAGGAAVVDAGGTTPEGGPPSLSYLSHTGPRPCPENVAVGPASVTVWKGGETVEARVCPKGESGQPLQGGGRRGQVKTVMSQASKRELARFLGKLNTGAVVLFVTLTIPAKACPPPDQLAAIKRCMRKRFERAYPAHGAIWKREHHRSGVPHLHLLIYPPAGSDLRAEVQGLRRWLAGAWSESIGTRSRVAVEAAAKARKVKDYVGSYLWRGKGYQLDAHGVHWGKWWGTWNAQALPHAEPVTVQGPPAMYHAVVRASKRAGYRGRFQRPGQPSAGFLARHDPEPWVRLALANGGMIQGNTAAIPPATLTGAFQGLVEHHQGVTVGSPVTHQETPPAREG